MLVKLVHITNDDIEQVCSLAADCFLDDTLEHIRKNFEIDNERAVFERNKNELLLIYDMRSNIIDKKKKQ